MGSGNFSKNSQDSSYSQSSFRFRRLYLILTSTMSTVLIPLDSSKNSKYCLEYYLQQIHREGNTVHIYVADYFGDVGPLEGPTPGRIAELEQEDKAKAAVIEQEVLQIFKAKQINGDFKRVFGKDVWHAVLNQANELNASLICLGSRGLGKFRRTLLGSVSDSVVHHSHIPVLVVKMPEGQE